ncbi:MAG: histidine phosphatase family protein [Dechloromonas sp.]|nr:histidine phosphatase family protein [Dechloromonas sp.]
MKSLFTLPIACLLAFSFAWGAEPTAKPAFVEKPITPDLLNKIRTGGFVLYMRHGNTDNTRPDRVPKVDLADCSTQRPLSDDGRKLMKQVGKAIRDARIPLGQILVSPMCRTKESAQLAIGENFQIVESLMYSANMTSEEKKPRIEALKKLLALPVPPDANTLMIAHAPNLDDLIGFFVKPEGTIVVFGVGGANGYEYLASIHPEDWPTLLQK